MKHLLKLLLIRWIKFIDMLLKNFNCLSVDCKMLQVLHRFALYLYNFSSITSLSYRDHRYHVSKLLTLINFLKMPLVLAVALVISLNVSLRNAIFKKNLADLDNFSIFSKLIVTLSVSLVQLIALVMNWIQVAKCNKIKMFLNNAAKIPLGPKYCQKFKNACSLDFKILGLLYVANHILQFFGTVKATLFTPIFSTIMFYASVLFTAFVGFIKNFENFLVASLKELKHELKSPNLKADPSYFSNVCKKYQRLYDLTEEFHSCLGLQLTIMTCYSAVMLVFNVNIYIFS